MRVDWKRPPGQPTAPRARGPLPGRETNSGFGSTPPANNKSQSFSIWWPGISHHISQMVLQCETCCKTACPKKEPLQSTPLPSLPSYPFHTVGTDLLELEGVHYLLTVDYFSRYPEVTKLTSTTSSSVISALKAVFSRHGIPEVVRSDNGPQYSSHEFTAFAKCYGFRHATSSPLYPQSNGQAERMVKTVKQLISSSDDPYLALLTYRATPLPWCDLSPSELCMGRKIRTPVPQTNELLVPKWPYLPDFRERHAVYKGHQKKNFDSHHGVRPLPDIPDDSEVWIQTCERYRSDTSRCAPLLCGEYSVWDSPQESATPQC